jgi:hypothetical protein
LIDTQLESICEGSISLTAVERADENDECQTRAVWELTEQLLRAALHFHVEFDPYLGSAFWAAFRLF